MANSAIYNRSGRAIADAKSAVSRIGFNTLGVLAAAAEVGRAVLVRLGAPPVALDDQTLTSILQESAAEVESLIDARRA